MMPPKPPFKVFVGHSDKEEGTKSEPEQFHKETVKSVGEDCLNSLQHISKDKSADIKAQTLTAGFAQYMFQDCL